MATHSRSTSTAVLNVARLRKEYPGLTAVDDVSFRVDRKEIVGLLGPNGAGKTTIINMILGLLKPTAGSIQIETTDLERERMDALNYCNFAAVYAPLPGNLTVRQNLRVFGMLYDVENLPSRIDDLLSEFDLQHLRDTKCGVLSSGEQSRVLLAKAMLNSPTLLLLDEPTASLDPAAAHEIRQRIRQFASNGTSGILWTSHNMYEVEAVCDRVLLLSRGKIILQGDPRELPRQHGKTSLEELFIAVAREPLAASWNHLP